MGTNRSDAMDDRWLSLSEIAVYLGVSKDSVYRWLETRDMPAHKIGRQWKFKVGEVDAWVRSGQADFMAGAGLIAKGKR
jgi:excisionase family DNA binding protein